MRMLNSWLIVSFFVALAIFALVGPARAVTVPYTVDGSGPMHFPGPVTPPANAPWGPNGYPGDTVELLPYSGGLDLTPGTHIQKINTLAWTVDYTYAGTATDPNAWSELTFNVNAPRTISFGASADVLNQTGLLDCNWDTDYLSFAAGSTTALFVQGYRVRITPLLIAPIDAGGSANPPWVQPQKNMTAQFDVDLAFPGDANLDGTTDNADLGTLLANYDRPGGWTQGDFSGDGWVGNEDLGILLANYDRGYGVPILSSSVSLTTTPEPSSFLLLAIAAAAAVGYVCLTRRFREKANAA
jgi:hypothetical protein